MNKNSGNGSAHTSTKLRAAEYVRMSTEHQQYSTDNQRAKIREYANERDIDIVRTYADEGKSGLRITGRASLQKLVKDVQSRTGEFDIILVYDISRWGRFQDADESAYYEYLCRSAGVQVAYCAEMFENDGSPVSTIVKSVKRAMAGEYSRELSVKVFAGQSRLAAMGYKQGGGPPGYGLRRTLVDQNGAVKGEMAPGDRKALQTDHVILTHGPRKEVETVVAIYEWFVTERLGEAEICKRLNLKKIKNGVGRLWNVSGLHSLLTNEKYIGNNIFNKKSFKLKLKYVVNAPDLWVRKDGAFEPMVDAEIFSKAQQIINARPRPRPRQYYLDALRELYAQHAYLDCKLIDRTAGMPSSSAYADKFGSISAAYKLVGFRPKRGQRPLRINLAISRFFPEVALAADAQFGTVDGDWVTHDARNIAMAACYLAKLFEDGPALAALKTRCPDLIAKIADAVRLDVSGAVTERVIALAAASTIVDAANTRGNTQ